MPKRIYALAKELKLDSKRLVELCTEAGIEGKGSPLASLSDEEIAQVKEHMRSGSAKSAPPAQSSTAVLEPDRPQRPASAPSGKVPSLQTGRRDEKDAAESTEAPAPEQPEIQQPEPPAAEEQPQETPPAPEPVAKSEPPKPEPEPVARKEEPRKPPLTRPGGRPSGPTEGGAPLRREDYIGPSGGSGGGRPRVLGGGGAGARPQPARGSDKPGGAEPDKTGKGGAGNKPKPTVRLAPMPNAPQAPAPKKSEPKALKPDMKLPADAIAASKKGKEPLSALLREERKRHQDETEDKSAAGTKRKGKEAAGDEKDDLSRMAGDRKSRQLNRNRRAKNRRGDDEDGGSSYRSRRLQRKGTNTAAPRKDAVTVQIPCTVREFSEALGVPSRDVIRQLIPIVGLTASITSTIDEELADTLAIELGVDVKFRAEVDIEEQVLGEILEMEDPEESLKERPPVVTFLGHVDHGKTSLLDRLIGIDVVSGESGGITQHIRAYQVDKDGRAVTFVDTPGHEAFTEMRARGANVTDLAVLVIAADDGIMPQTEEALSHAQAAGCPIVIALNKTDLPTANPDRVYQQLAERDMLPAEWGGTTEVVKTSAITGAGLDDLLETLLTLAELHEYKANPDRPAVGTCLEAQLHEGRGVMSKIIVQKGTLKTGDVLVCGSAYGRVKAMHDTLIHSQRYDEAGPSMPVDLSGLNEAPAAGEKFYVVGSVAEAREIAEKRAETSRQANLSGNRTHVTLENFRDVLGRSAEVQTLNLILRADVRGSIEAIQKELGKLEHPEVKLKILQATVGGVTEADVYLADAADAVIIGFNVVPEEGARNLADDRGVQVRRYDVIYKITEDLKAALEGMLEPEKQERELGRALVLQTFNISRVGTIAGCRVLKDTVMRNARVRVIRDQRIIGDYAIDTLRREKDDVREVKEGYECGIKLAGFNDVKEGDVLEVYAVEEVKRTF